MNHKGIVRMREIRAQYLSHCPKPYVNRITGCYSLWSQSDVWVISGPGGPPISVVRSSLNSRKFVSPPITFALRRPADIGNLTLAVVVARATRDQE